MPASSRDCDSIATAQRSPAAAKLALALLIVAVSTIHVIWVLQDQSFSPINDAYLYLMRLLRFVDGLGPATLVDPLPVLAHLSAGGRPPLYQLLTTPFILLLGRSEDAALMVNLCFLAVLLIAVYQMGRLVKNDAAGLLAAIVVISYPPIIHLSRMYVPHFAVPACTAASLWLLLLLMKRRSVRVAWLFGATLGFGLLIHPHFVWIMAIPTAVFGAYLVLFQTLPRRPARLRAAPGWLLDKLGDPFVLRGLVPGALIALLLALPWYLTRGRSLLFLLLRLSSPEIAEYRGSSVVISGFPGTEASFWWYLRTSPQALSYFFAVLLIVSAVFGVIRRRLSVTVLLTTLASTYVVLSLLSTRAWWLFAGVLPVAAVLTASCISGVHHRRLAAGLTALCLVMAVLNFAIVTWGVPASARPLAEALGSPLDSATCRVRSSVALCPSPPLTQPEGWPIREILATIVKDSGCREQPCRLMLPRVGEMMWARFNYLAVQNWPQARLITADEGSPFAGLPYNYLALLKSDYLLFPAERTPGRAISYYAATMRFLESPPAAFVDAHRELARFALPDGTTARLLKRIRPLRIEEAEASIAALDLPERYKTQKFEVLAMLYAAEGRFESDAVVKVYEEALRRVTNPVTGAKLRRALADAYLARGDSGRALALFQEALDANPRDVYSRVRTANIYSANGEVERAAAELETGISLTPEEIWPRRALGMLYQSMGKPDQAISLYRDILEIDPHNADARRALDELTGGEAARPDRPR